MGNRTYHPRGRPVDGYSVREHPIYQVWVNMLARCFKPNTVGYENYGGRGVEVCPRWFHFENFANDMGVRPSDLHTIERVDNNKGYCPDNCIWDTRSNQCLNRRKFRNNTSGVTGVVAIAYRYEARFDYEHVRYRIGRFWSADEAKSARDAFEYLFFVDRDAALRMIPSETTWCTSKTKERGVSPHVDGGFVARVTANGVRVYLGYFKTVDEARNARNRFLKG